MEDAATAEISRTQVWQWVRHRVPLEDGTTVDAALVRDTVAEILRGYQFELGPAYRRSRFPLAARLFEDLMTAPECPEWLTVTAYDHLD
jgi:malate synthase